jgi:ubiquinone/menaquinone biosynthesis C-methylase UbiE
MTKRWYEEVICRLPENAHVLDVGIGTGSALICNADKVLEKKLDWTGVDIDSNYVKYCSDALRESSLCNVSSVLQADIYDSNNLSALLCSSTKKRGKKTPLFDAVYFSGSFSLLPQPAIALQIAKGVLRPGGKVYVTQTFQHKSFPLLGLIKPALKYLTTIDFGKLTFAKDVSEIIRNSGLTLKSMEVIKGSIDSPWQSAFILECE